MTKPYDSCDFKVKNSCFRENGLDITALYVQWIPVYPNPDYSFFSGLSEAKL